ncbi:MAG TPA: redoxin domain-containing protein [Chryseolinea sp.]|nr:redoxin domain-containing protein [Chryseolinea sp.]
MNKLVFTLFFCVVALVSCSKKQGDEQTLSESASSPINEQPAIPLTLLDNTQVNVKDLTGKNALIFFQPDCDHCQREAQEFERNLEAFAGTTLYFITSGPLEEIKAFADTYKLSGRPNVHFAFTPALNVLNSYGPISAPSVYVYSGDHQLVKAFNGETPIEKILAAIR